MTKSKFSLWIFLILGQVAVFTLVLIKFFKRVLISNLTQPGLTGYLIASFFILVLIVLVFGELRTKAIKVTIDKEKISVRKYLGFGELKHYYFKDFSGFKISYLPSAGAVSEFLYLMIKDKKVIKLSAFYHRNYTNLREANSIEDKRFRSCIV